MRGTIITVSDQRVFKERGLPEKQGDVLLGAESHHSLDSSSAVPRPIKNDDLSGCWEIWHEALVVPVHRVHANVGVAARTCNLSTDADDTIIYAARRGGRTGWEHHCVFSRSDGVPGATTRRMRGDIAEEMRLITPPFPAASRPSKMTTSFDPDARTHSAIFTSSICSRPRLRS